MKHSLETWLPKLQGLEKLQSPVIVGCSGGADSTALLALVSAMNLAPIAVHVDHGLRTESASESEVVKEFAETLGAEFLSRTIEVTDAPNLEERARDARYQTLESARQERNASVVLVGHTADDQAETVLLNLLRGSGPSGLAGMSVRRDNLVRPLLAFRRSDTEKICSELGLQTLNDPMNDDRSFRRVWIRHELLPLLEKVSERDLVPILTRQAQIFGEESAFLNELAAQAWPGAEAKAKDLAQLPDVLARRAIRIWIGGPPISRSESDRVLQVAQGHVKAVELAGERRVYRSGGQMFVEKTSQSGKP